LRLHRPDRGIPEATKSNQRLAILQGLPGIERGGGQRLLRAIEGGLSPRRDAVILHRSAPLTPADVGITAAEAAAGTGAPPDNPGQPASQDG
jgi:hypothetical protein